MDAYTLSFVIAFVVGLVPTIIFCKNAHRRFFAFVLYIFLFYIFFYDFNEGVLGGFFPIFHVFAGAAYTCLLLIFLLSLEKESVPQAPVKNRGKILFFSIAQFFCVLFTQVVPWGVDTFPLSNIDAILFTVFAGANEGAENFVLESFIDKALLPAGKIFALLWGIQIVLTIIIIKTNTNFTLKLWRIRYPVSASGFANVLARIHKVFLVFMTAMCAILFFVVPNILMSAPFRALVQIPVDSEMYREDYVYPDSVQIKAAGSTKNLIVIMLESMETNFAHHTPELNAWAAKATNFTPGGENVAGTSWTIAAITGKLCGIPLNMPMGIGEYLGKLPTYLPNAKCMMNILADKGYSQVYIQGSSGDFTQKRDFWKVHGNVAVHDIEHYVKQGRIPEGYKVFWGFEDRKLYQFAKEEIDSLSKIDKPFAVYMLTVDTHQPNGYVDDSCAVQVGDVDGLLPKSLRCASIMLDSFMTWASRQPWYGNTVISVMGDHSMQSLSKKAGVPLTDSLYWVNFMFNSAVDTPVRERAYSSLDMFPTLLESMGFSIDGRAIGLGRSLYSDKPTLIEKYGRNTLDSLLRVRSIQYDYFLMGGKSN